MILNLYKRDNIYVVPFFVNNFFCLMTMNHHPVHIDALYSKKTRFKKNLVVGTYVFSLIVGMTVQDISLSAIANLGYEKIVHLGPVFIGDTLYAKSKVLSKRKSKKPSFTQQR